MWNSVIGDLFSAGYTFSMNRLKLNFISRNVVKDQQVAPVILVKITMWFALQI